MTGLDWYRASSADTAHDDQEIDLDRIGNPGGGSWAFVASEGDGWEWGVLDHWLWEDNSDGQHAQYLAQGVVATQEEAKQAVIAWVEAHREQKEPS